MCERRGNVLSKTKFFSSINQDIIAVNEKLLHILIHSIKSISTPQTSGLHSLTRCKAISDTVRTAVKSSAGQKTCPPPSLAAPEFALTHWRRCWEASASFLCWRGSGRRPGAPAIPPTRNLAPCLSPPALQSTEGQWRVCKARADARSSQEKCQVETAWWSPFYPWIGARARSLYPAFPPPGFRLTRKIPTRSSWHCSVDYLLPTSACSLTNSGRSVHLHASMRGKYGKTIWDFPGVNSTVLLPVCLGCYPCAYAKC